MPDDETPSISPKASTKKSNGLSVCRPIAKSVVNDSPGDSRPSGPRSVAGMVRMAPAPAGPPSALISTLLLVSVATSKKMFLTVGEPILFWKVAEMV